MQILIKHFINRRKDFPIEVKIEKKWKLKFYIYLKYWKFHQAYWRVLCAGNIQIRYAPWHQQFRATTSRTIESTASKTAPGHYSNELQFGCANICISRRGGCLYLPVPLSSSLFCARNNMSNWERERALGYCVEQRKLVACIKHKGFPRHFKLQSNN